jgi:chromosome segregation ATPase
MVNNGEKKENRGFFSRFRRGPRWHEVFGYHVGDIQTQQPVAVASGATVVGNIYAPQIVIVGLLSGSAISREVVVKTEGQIWGDIYAVRLHLEPGGLIRGWINTLTETDYVAWQNGQDVADELTPSGLRPEHNHRRDGETLDALHRLQMETAVALAARYELEETFDQRLAEIAGETTSLLAATREELKNSRAALATWQEEANTSHTTLQQREAQLERQGQELSLAQQTLAETAQELDDLRQTYTELTETHATLIGAKAAVDEQLVQTLEKIESLTDRTHTLETALQDSLEHRSDQEDALLRWQELAQRNEQRAKELEKELETARQQIEESNQIIERLRAQRQQIETEWEQMQQDNEALRQELAQERQNAQQQLADSAATIQSLTEKVSSLEDDHASAIQDATETNARLEAEIAPLRKRNTALLRQMDMAKEKFFKQEEVAAILRQQYEEMQKRWQEAQLELDRISQQPTKLLSSEQVETLQTKLDEAEATIRKKQLQLEASEAELQRHLQETAVQGQRLAENHALLIERELQLQQAQQTIAKQQQFIKQMKQVTAEKITRLETALADMRK